MDSTISGQFGNGTGSIGSIGVNYVGEVLNTSQLSVGPDLQPGGGTWVPAATYISATVPNAPDNPGLITLGGVSGPLNLNTVSFSTPVTDPVMAIWSLGQPTNFPATWAFDQPFTILSSGTGSYGGPNSLTSASLNLLIGNEGYGVIQFQGVVSSISWTVAAPPEYYNGFTVGAAVPEPVSLVVWSVLGLTVSASWLRRRRTVA